MAVGFFGDLKWSKQKVPLPLVPQCGLCQLDKKCLTPKMPPTGKGKQRVLIVAEAPGQNEDRKGIQLKGNAGMELVKLLDMIDVNMRRDCWLTNAIICRPMDGGGKNRKPLPKEVGWCRPNLSRTILELQPDVIIPLGGVAMLSLIPLAWRTGEVDKVGTWVGWQIPSSKLNAWICPTYHPSYLLRSEGQEKLASNTQVIELHMIKHLKGAFALKGKPWLKPPDWRARVRVEMDAERAAAGIVGYMDKGKPLAFDYETNMLKPDSPLARILCCSISDGETSLAFPWHGAVVPQMKKFLQSKVPKISANLEMEERWTRRILHTAVRNWDWDTVSGAHWRDCRHGICSLKFQAFVLLGAEDYSSHLDPYMEAKDSNTPNRLDEIEPAELLLYCGLDSLFEALVAQKQREW